MTTDVKPLLLLSYDKEPVVLYETRQRLHDGTWRVTVHDKNGRMLHETQPVTRMTVLKWSDAEPKE